MRDMVPTKEGMQMANPCFIATMRSTVCDIMCTTNVAKPVSVTKASGGADSLLASIPYQKVKSITGPYKATTKFQKYKSEGVDQSKKDELRRDRREFYANLLREKEEVFEKKRKAATKIQASFRGYRKRPGKCKYMPQKKTIHIYTQNEMQDELCTLAAGINLKPIPGMSLEARSKASKRRQKIESAAAFILQRFFRMLVSRNMARVVVKSRLKEKLHRSARIVTRAVRFSITKKFVKRVDIIKREKAVKTVQCYVRGYLARKMVKILMKFKWVNFRRNEAAIIIQRNLAERHRGALRMARASLASLKSFRKLVNLVMDGIISIVIDQTYYSYLDNYAVLLESKGEELAEYVEEESIAEELDSLLESAMFEFIMEKLKRIEEENRRITEQRMRMEENMLMTREEELVKTLIDAHKKAQLAVIGKEKRRRHLYAVQRERFVESIVENYLYTGLDIQFERIMRDYEAKLFTKTVVGVVDYVTEIASSNATSLLITQFLLDLANQTSLVIADVASRLTGDTISVGLSLFTDRQSYLAREMAEIMNEEASTVMEVEIAEAEAMQFMTEEQNSLVDEVHSEVIEMDDEECSVGGTGAMQHAMGRPVTDIVKEVRGAAQYITQAHYEAALQDLAPALALIEGKLEEAETLGRPEHIVVKMSVVLSVLLFLKAKVLFLLARYQEVKDILQEVHEIRKEAFDSNHYLVGEEMCARAEWMRSQALYGPADKLLLEANAILAGEIKGYDEAGKEVGYSNTVFKLHHRTLLSRIELLRNGGQYYKAQDLLLRLESSLQKYKQLGLVSFEIEEDFIVSLMSMFILSGRRRVAMQWHENLLMQRKNRYGDRHPKIASSLCILGKLAFDLGELDKGLQLIEDGVNMRYEFYPPQHPAHSAGHLLKATAFTILGKCHEGFLEAAKGLHGFQTTFANMKPVHPAVGNSLMVLGIVQLSVGEPHLAGKSFSQALDIFRANFSLELHVKINEVIMWHCVSLVHRRMFKKAINELRVVVEQRERILQILRVDRQQQNFEHVDLEMAKVYLGYCYAMTGQIGSALSMLPEAVKKLQGLLSEEHPHISLGLCYLAQLHKCRGNYADAKDILGQCYDRLNRSFPQGHPLTSVICCEAADNLRIPGFVDEAIDINETGFKITETVYAQSPGNTYTAQLLQTRAELLGDMGAYEEAESLYMQSINILQQKAGVSSGSYAIGLLSLSEFYHQQQRWQLAERSYLQALRLLKPHVGSKSIIYQQGLLQYGILLMDAHQWLSAKELLQNEILPILHSVLNAQHPLCLYAEANLVICLYMQQTGQELSLTDSNSLSLLSEKFLNLPKVQNFLAFWSASGFSLSHRWLVRIQQLPELLSNSMSASLFDSTSLNYYSAVSANEKDLSSRKSALSVISEKDAEDSLSNSFTRSYADEDTIYSDNHTFSQDGMSEASQSVYSASLGTGTYDYDYNSHASTSYLSPRSLSYASHTNTLSPRSNDRSYTNNDSNEGSPRSHVTDASHSKAHSQTPSRSWATAQPPSGEPSVSQSLAYSQSPSTAQQSHMTPSTELKSRLINVEESNLEGWEQSPNRSIVSTARDGELASSYEDQDQDDFSVLTESQLQESHVTLDPSLEERNR